LTRAYEAEEHRAARDSLLPGISLAAAAFVLGLLGELDPVTSAMCVTVIGLMGWALSYEALVWRRFGVGSIYMAWMRRKSRTWWRHVGLGARPSPARVSEWLERHARDPGLAAERASASIVLGRTAQARAEIAQIDAATAAERWARARLLAFAAMVDGRARPAVQDLRQAVEELGEPRQRMAAEADVIAFDIDEIVAAGGDWRRELRIAVERVNEALVSSGLGDWQFRLRPYDWAAYAAGALGLLVLGGLLIAQVVSVGAR
jgi:hypothetical protein